MVIHISTKTEIWCLCRTEMHETWVVDPERRVRQTAPENRRTAAGRDAGQAQFQVGPPVQGLVPSPPEWSAGPPTFAQRNTGNGSQEDHAWGSSPYVRSPTHLPSTQGNDLSESRSSAQRRQREATYDAPRRPPAYATPSVNSPASPPPSYDVVSRSAGLIPRERMW